MRNQSIENLECGAVRVCLLEDARSICTTVSSHHLIEDKWRQLHLALDKTQTKAESDVTQPG